MSPNRLSRLESALRITLEFIETLNRHDVARMARLVSEDCVLESSGPAPDGGNYKGKDEIIRFWQDFFQASPQARFEIEDAFGMGERCVVRWKDTGAGENGQKEHVRGVDIFRVRNELIIEKLSYVKG